MDEVWAIGVLEWWIETVNQIRGSSYGGSGRTERNNYVDPGSAQFTALRAREDQTRRVLARALGEDELPEILLRGSMSNSYWVSSGLDKAEYAIGKLRTDAETRAKLGSNAPTMKADALHPLIWGAASKRWESAHYSDAVQRAATALSGLVKDQIGRYELGDADLMSQAFSLTAPPRKASHGSAGPEMMMTAQ
ncbi:TIGR02391 family protein [Microbacterium sp. NPDC058389]|uniref:TIGR02391 family protein n=1 Tax=Microbacterium sp. NPDC058389 TaxID=3346475 RepID=UPI00365EC27E